MAGSVFHCFHWTPSLSGDTRLREQSLRPQLIAILLQFYRPLFELRVEDGGGGEEDDQEAAQHHQEGGPRRVGHWQTLAGVDSVVLVASHTVWVELNTEE